MRWKLSKHVLLRGEGLHMTSARLGNDTNDTNAQVILEVAKAVSAHLDLSDVLEALIATLKPLIAFDAVGVGVLEWEEIRLHSVYIEGLPRVAGESAESVIARRASDLNIKPPTTKKRVSEHFISDIIKFG